MKTLMAFSLILALGACASAPGGEGDVATYDALKVKRDACVASGGTLVLQDQGDDHRLSHFACKRK